MALGFPANASESRRFSASPDAIGQAAVGVFQALGWQYTGSTPGLLLGKVGISAMSWGEKLSVAIAPDGTVTVNSAGAFPLQWLDWGKNRRNCLKFLDALAQAVPRG